MTVKSSVTRNHREHGFTLIEVSLALVFIAFIIMFLSGTLISVLGAYNKGIWTSQVNQAGRQINDDLGDQARYAGTMQVLADEQRICTGGVSYLWNVTKSDGSGDGYVNYFASGDSASVTPGSTATYKNSKLRLVRVDDPSASYCSTPGQMPPRNSDKVKSLLAPGTAILRFGIDEMSEAKGLYNIDMVFSTDDRDNQPAFKDGNWKCGQWVGGYDVDANFKEGKRNQYCAFIQYDVTLYARGGSV